MYDIYHKKSDSEFKSKYNLKFSVNFYILLWKL